MILLPSTLLQLSCWTLLLKSPVANGFVQSSTRKNFQRMECSKIQEKAEIFRKPLMTGNWKLNPTTKSEAIDLVTSITANLSEINDRDVMLFVPFPFIESVNSIVNGKISIGAEMVSAYQSGAYTGEVSASMLKSCGVNWVLVGHSERRSIYKESDEYIRKQCQALMDQDMAIVLCIGETLEEYEKGLVNNICEIQLKNALAGLDIHPEKLVIAYEPVWAIGTGKVATPQIAQSVHKVCRAILTDLYGERIANQIRILYGGSVTPESVDGLMAQPDIDGTLVGGASLDSEKFSRIINFRKNNMKAKLASLSKAVGGMVIATFLFNFVRRALLS